MSLPQKLAWLGAAGALGALARYALGGWVQARAGAGFPWGTLAVNGLGCLAFGAIWSLAAERALIGPEIRVVLLVGFLGAFTTFSSYAFETGQMLRDAQWGWAAANVLLQNGLGLIGLWAGHALGRGL